MSMILTLLAVMVGEEVLVDHGRCTIMSQRVWKGIHMARLCCAGTVYLAQDDEITAQDGECALNTVEMGQHINWLAVSICVYLKAWWF